MSQRTFFSYNAKTTSISFPWPDDVTGLERIALSAQGDLQRVLSAFFARPISIALVYSDNFNLNLPDQQLVPLSLPNPVAIKSASPNAPIVQTRQVHLQCGGKIVCTATSTVRITSPQCAHLFLEEKYAIGQMFSRLEKLPAFELLSVGVGPVADAPRETQKWGGTRQDEQLWRKYKLTIPDFECEILEVFPSREMFIRGESWLEVEQRQGKEAYEFATESYISSKSFLQPPKHLTLLLGFGFLLMLVFELYLFFAGRSPIC